MALETKQVLITVKTYPNPSTKYGETVCCAGIDLETGSWIRLYPVPFRDLDASQKFKKYNIISVRCNKAPKDHRAESYHIDRDSIRVLRRLDTKHKWRERGKVVLPTASRSFCDVQRAYETTSLGMFKPCDIGFSWQKAKAESEAKRQACYEQLTFFDERKNTIERVPLDFYYEFHCEGEETCPGHRLRIIDWEMGQSYRNWREKYGSQDQLLDKIRQMWLSTICSEENDIWFYVGNMYQRRHRFMVLGVFYPKK
jgi:hypothetical protein